MSATRHDRIALTVFVIVSAEDLSPGQLEYRIAPASGPLAKLAAPCRHGRLDEILARGGITDE